MCQKKFQLLNASASYLEQDTDFFFLMLAIYSSQKEKLKAKSPKI